MPETSAPGFYVAGNASASTQLDGRRELIETSHVHVERIIAALKGNSPPPGGSFPTMSALEND